MSILPGAERFKPIRAGNAGTRGTIRVARAWRREEVGLQVQPRRGNHPSPLQDVNRPYTALATGMLRAETETLHSWSRVAPAGAWGGVVGRVPPGLTPFAIELMPLAGLLRKLAFVGDALRYGTSAPGRRLIRGRTGTGTQCPICRRQPVGTAPQTPLGLTEDNQLPWSG
jgi:hypothetical protein